jgi:ElaB/YqjD/DUF883 family membrane-anchored ribosome-binding protein
MNGTFDASPSAQMFTDLQKMQQGIAQLVETDSARREEMEFLADLREKLVGALTILHEQLVDVGQKVNKLATPPAKKVEPWWKPWVRCAYGVAVGIVLTSAVWLVWSRGPSYEAFAIDVNRTIRQVYDQLPKKVQEDLRAVYRQHHFIDPGQRGNR